MAGVGVDATLAGRYRLLRRVRDAAAGEVWVADDQRFAHRRVDIEIFRADLSSVPTEVERRRQVIQALRWPWFSHQNALRIILLGEDGSTRFAILEHIEGETLANLLRRQGRLDPQEAARIAAEVADAIQKAHEAGVVHGDLGTENVMLTADGSPRVLDLGLTPVAWQSWIAPWPSGDAEVEGAPPRQVPGPSREPSIDVRQPDLYALGSLLYEMLAGRTPAIVVGMAGVESGPESIEVVAPWVPKPLVAITDRALSAELSDRPPSAGSFAAAIRLSGSAPAARTAPGAAPPDGRLRRDARRETKATRAQSKAARVEARAQRAEGEGRVKAERAARREAETAERAAQKDAVRAERAARMKAAMAEKAGQKEARARHKAEEEEARQEARRLTAAEEAARLAAEEAARLATAEEAASLAAAEEARRAAERERAREEAARRAEVARAAEEAARLSAQAYEQAWREATDLSTRQERARQETARLAAEAEVSREAAVRLASEGQQAQEEVVRLTSEGERAREAADRREGDDRRAREEVARLAAEAQRAREEAVRLIAEEERARQDAARVAAKVEPAREEADRLAAEEERAREEAARREVEERSGREETARLAAELEQARVERARIAAEEEQEREEAARLTAEEKRARQEAARLESEEQRAWQEAARREAEERKAREGAARLALQEQDARQSGISVPEVPIQPKGRIASSRVAIVAVLVVLAVGVTTLVMANRGPSSPTQPAGGLRGTPSGASIQPPVIPVTVTVPPMAGSSVSEARAKLFEAGLEFEAAVPTAGPPGVVVASDPTVGAEVPPGTPVTLFVGTSPDRVGGGG